MTRSYPLLGAPGPTVLEVTNQSAHPGEEVERLVRFGLDGLDLGHLVVHVRNCGRGGHAGSAYAVPPAVSPVRGKADHLVVLRVGGEYAFPRTWQYPRCPRAPRVVLASWQEALVHLAAHEGQHVVQFRCGLPRSEVQCELVACARLEEWRRAQGIPAPAPVPVPCPAPVDPVAAREARLAASRAKAAKERVAKIARLEARLKRAQRRSALATTLLAKAERALAAARRGAERAGRTK